MKHANDRTEGKYDSLEHAKELAGYVLQITSNEKHFPKRYRLTVAAKLQERALSILDCLIMANEIYPNTRLEREQRTLYQKQARAACRSLMSLMEVASCTFGISAGTLEYFTKEARDLRNHITAWTQTDLDRFKNLR